MNYHKLLQLFINAGLVLLVLIGCSPAAPSPLFRVRVNGKWGYIDASGNVIIEPQYDMTRRFSEGLAEVKSGDKWGYVDTVGKHVIELQYDEVSYSGESSRRSSVSCIQGCLYSLGTG